MEGWQLGSDPEIQVATVVTNHLTAAIIKYFTDCFRLDKAANLFERMSEKEPEVNALLARSYIGMSESIRLNSCTDDQTRRSKRSKSCTKHFEKVRNPTLFFTPNATFCYQKADPTGHNKSLSKR